LRTGFSLERAPVLALSEPSVRPLSRKLLADFDDSVWNGDAEGVISKIRVIKRRGYGLSTFEGFRRGVLVACPDDLAGLPGQ
jgi:transposase